MNRKFAAGAVCALFVGCTLLTACQNGNGSNSSSTLPHGENETEETQQVFPHEVRTFSGMTFHAFADYNGPDGLEYHDFEMQEESENAIDSALYRRNQYVQTTFDVVLEDEMSQSDTFIQEFRKRIRSGDDSMQMGVVRYTNTRSLILNDCCYDFLDFSEQLSLDKPWWDQNIQKELAINKSVYILAGDLFYKHYDGIELLMFNKVIAENEIQQNLYELVKNGTWTLDKMYEICAGATKDLNGDQMITSDDRFALSSQIDAVTTFVLAAGNSLATHDESGSIQFNSDLEKVHNTVDKILKFYISETWDAHRDVACAYGPGLLFTEGRSLFNWGMARNLEYGLFREMEQDFGILPFPKYDDSQEAYKNYVNFYHGYGIVLPSSVKNPEDVAYIMDALAYYGREKILPTYYETCLTRRYTRDDESEEILDLIFENTTYDLAIYYNIGNIRDTIQKSFFQGLNLFSSEFAANQSILNRDLDELNDYTEK